MQQPKKLITALSNGANPVFSEEDYLWTIQEEQELQDLRFNYAGHSPRLSEEPENERNWY